MANYAKFVAEYEVSGGPDDGMVFPLTMQLCNDTTDWPDFYESNDAQKQVIEAHKEQFQFWCPKAFDLSLYNTYDNMENKVVNVYLTTCTKTENPICAQDAARKTWFEGKLIMLLTNSESVNFDQDKISVPERRSYLHWFPLQYLLPETTRVTIQRSRYQPDD